MNRSALLAFACLLLVPFATSVSAFDRLTEARMAAVNGDHALCSKISDEVRNSKGSSWYAHQVFASCKSLDARQNRTELGAERFETESMKAIDAIEHIVSNGKALTSRQRIKFSHMAVEMRKQLALDLIEIKTAAQ